MSETPRRFRVALTGDFFAPDGVDEISRHRPVGLRGTRAPRMGQVPRAPPDRGRPARRGAGVIVLTPSVTAETVAESRDLLAVGRFGVGYDAVDVAACTEADVVVFITAGAVDRSVAEATVGWMIALDASPPDQRHPRAHRPLGRAFAVHGPRAARPDLRRHRTGRNRPGDRGPCSEGFGMKTPLAFDPLPRRPDRRTARACGTVGARRAAGRGGFRLDPLPAHRPDPRPDRPP